MKKILSLSLALIFVLLSFALSSCEYLEGYLDLPEIPEMKTYYIPTRIELTTDEGVCSISINCGENKLPEEEILTRFGSVIQTREYIYDSNGYLIQLTQKNPDGSIINIAEHKYDSNGLRTESFAKDENGSIDMHSKYEYNSDGQLTQRTTRGGGQTDKTVYSYDENGKLCGDVDFEAVKEVAGAITPVPGGVGPMTIVSLMRNTLLAGKKCIY